MDVFILDELLRRSEVIDTYESFIWTERYSAYGDFELVIRSTAPTRKLLQVGTLLAINKSYRVMLVETVENFVEDDGSAKLKVYGRSIEALLEHRVNQVSTISGGTSVEYSEIIGTPGYVARTFFDTVCRNNFSIPQDKLPFLVAGSLFPAGSIPEPTDTITFRYENDSVYNSIKKVCDVYKLGFRLVRNGDESELYFDVYTGDDRTASQQTNEPVIFSTSLDNLSKPADLTSDASFKNVAYVFGKNASKIVYADNYDSSVAGLDRRVLVVTASDIDLPVGAGLDQALIQKGKEELAQYRAVVAFEGEIPEFGSYAYGTDYDLGDLVSQMNIDGFVTNLLVTEQIFISDQEGERAYPTLTIDRIIPPGTWDSWNATQMWESADIYWDDAS